MQAFEAIGKWPLQTEVTNDNAEIKVTIWNFTGNFFRVLRETDRAFHEFNSCLKALEQTDKDQAGLLYLNMAICHSSLKK